MLSADGVFSLEPAELAPSDLLELAHDPAYVEGFLHGALDPALMRRIGFPWSLELTAARSLR